MKINNVSTVQHTQNTNFNGFVCSNIYKRAEKFCSPEKMNEFMSSCKKDLYDKPMDRKSVKLYEQYKNHMRRHNRTIAELNRCVENKYNDAVCLTVRPVDKTEKQQSVLSLFNLVTGKIIDVSPYFNTAYGDITNLLARFIKRAHSYVAEIEKPSTLYK